MTALTSRVAIPGVLPRAVIAGYGRYGALNGATGRE